MMLKKQTVWLLTMLSLIVVLSIYYMSSPEPMPSDQVAAPASHKDQKQEKKSDTEKPSQSKDEDQKTNAEKSSVETSIAGDEDFTEAEIGMEKARSKLTEQYTDVIASDVSSAQEKTEAQEKIEELQQTSSREQMLESLIVANGYKDALVNVQGSVVDVLVKANKLTNKQVVNIIDLVKSHIDDAYDVAVTFSPIDK